MKGELEADIVFEDDRVVAFRDIHPQAPVHLLVVPRREIETLNETGEDDEALLGHMVFVATRLAGEMGIDHGYRLVMNCGPGGGQTVFHIHLHLLGGRQMHWPPG
jgi:histidine triad (HIT) family protein